MAEFNIRRIGDIGEIHTLCSTFTDKRIEPAEYKAQANEILVFFVQAVPNPTVREFYHLLREAYPILTE